MCELGKLHKFSLGVGLSFLSGINSDQQTLELLSAKSFSSRIMTHRDAATQSYYYLRKNEVAYNSFWKGDLNAPFYSRMTIWFRGSPAMSSEFPESDKWSLVNWVNGKGNIYMDGLFEGLEIIQ